MKKIVSLLIVAAMLISTVAVCVLPAAAAGGGDFHISIKKEDLFDNIPEDDKKSVPGYIYAADGLRVNPLDEGNPEDPDFKDYSEYRATWPNNTPYYSIQTSSEVILKGGFFMEVRVDAFTIMNTDKWLGFSVWDSLGLQLGQVGVDKEGRDWGNGVETLIRLNSDTNHAEKLSWNDDTELVESGRRGVTPSDYTNFPTMYKEDEQGRQIVTLEIQYDPDGTGLYSFKINDIEAPDAYREALTYWLQNRGEKAYVGFSIQSAVQNGEASVTVTKIGDSKLSATTPIGDQEDWTKAIQRDNVVADIVPKDEADLEEGAPAIWISAEDDESYKSYTSLAGNVVISPTPEGTFKFTLEGSDCADPVFRLPNTVSYDLNDYPIAFIVVKNYCTCPYEDLNQNGSIDDYDKVCRDKEAIMTFYHAGPHFDGVEKRQVYTKIPELTTVDAYGNVYSVFYCDMSVEAAAEEGPQRIHGFMPRFNYIKYQEPGRGEFELISLSYFASQEDGGDYISDYFAANLDMEIDTETTEAPDAGDTTEAPDAGETTEAPDGGETTEAPDAPQLPDADSALSIEEAITVGSSMQHNTYTEGKYYVTGVILEVYNEEYGNMKIVDENGNVLTVYGAFSADGETRYDALPVKPVAGDTVTIYGVIGQYSGTPQIKNGWIIFHEPAESETEEKTPETTEKPDGGETTEKPNTPATTEKPADKDNEPVKSGCGSVAGFGAMAIVAVAALGLVSFKKKED